MRLVEPSVEILDYTQNPLQLIELCGRVCYKSEDKITADSAERFVRNIIKSGHESVLEHAKVTVRVICDRGVSHEIVRHRLASYSQESTRYVCYKGDMAFIKPSFTDVSHYQAWLLSVRDAEEKYHLMIDRGAKPEEARSVLPNSLKTELVMTMNLREWRHFFKMRLSKRAHPQMREVASLIYTELRRLIPVVFDDLEVQET